jgi:hypothetical protein
MTTTSQGSKGARLGTRFRGKLAASYGQRGVGPNSLWYVYSPRSRTDWVLRSDLEWDHFVLAESDPDLVNCVYAPDTLSVSLHGETVMLEIDAVLTQRNGTVEGRRIRYSTDDAGGLQAVMLAKHTEAAEALGMRYSVWSEEQVRRNHMQLANWRRVIAWLAAARDRSLAAYELDLERAMKSEAEMTLADIEVRFGEATFPLYAAAAFSGIQQGKYLSDLDKAPLSSHTAIIAADQR